MFVNTSETTRSRRGSPQGLALRREPQASAVEDMGPQSALERDHRITGANRTEIDIPFDLVKGKLDMQTIC